MALGMARMFELLRDVHEKQIRVFRDHDASPELALPEKSEEQAIVPFTAAVLCIALRFPFYALSILCSFFSTLQTNLLHAQTRCIEFRYELGAASAPTPLHAGPAAWLGRAG